MCDVESVNRIAKYLKVNAGKVGYNGDKILMRTTKSESLVGFATILQSLARESHVSCVERTTGNPESQALISQWLDYAVLFVGPAGKDKHVATVLLKELNVYLSSRSYLVDYFITLADLAVFYIIGEIMTKLSNSEKDHYINISRWFNHLQMEPTIRQNMPLVNMSTIFLAPAGGH